VRDTPISEAAFVGCGVGAAIAAWFTHIPGLVVVAPSSPADAKGLLVSAIRDDNPVIFLESKLLYIAAAAPVPKDLYAIPIGRGTVLRQGGSDPVGMGHCAGTSQMGFSAHAGRLHARLHRGRPSGAGPAA
jgi:pyruvate/2-oxoglutarate/acetoin dehydrogenase E1 component